MSSFVIALDINQNHITATLVRIEQSLDQCLSIERDLFHIRSFNKNTMKKNPNLIISSWIDCIDDLIKDFVDNYKEDDHIIGIACSFIEPMDYEQGICYSQSFQCFGLNLRLLLQSGLRHLISRWKNNYDFQYSIPTTPSHASISCSKRQSVLEKTTLILLPSTHATALPLSVVSTINQEHPSSKLSTKKLREYCGLIENDDCYNENDQIISYHETPIHKVQSNSSKLRLTIEQLSEIPISFYNATTCFALGEANKIHNKNYERILILTIGTNFGFIFLDQGKIISDHPCIPSDGILSNCLYDEKFNSKDYFSTCGLINIYEKLLQRKVNIVDSYSLALCASNGDKNARKAFQIFAHNLGNFLIPSINDFNPNLLIIGGDIAQAWYLIESELNHILNKFCQIEIYFNISNEKSICFGAVQQQLPLLSQPKNQIYRQTNQYLLPVTKQRSSYEYDIYPCHEIPIGYIGIGHKQFNEKLFRLLKENKILLIDGFIGTNFDEFAYQLNNFYQKQMKTTKLSLLNIYDTRIFLEINENIKQQLQINIDFKTDCINLNKLNYLQNNLSYPCVIIGPSASFINEVSPLIYIDLPIHELNYRINAQRSFCSYFKSDVEYKYLSDFDYRIFNKLKQDLLSRLTYFVDSQRPHCPTWLDGETFRQALAHISNQPIRQRPIFQSNLSNNQCIKNISHNILQLPKNELKSVEIISSGNGIILSDINNHLVEFSSNIFYHSQAYRILGNDTHVRLFQQLNHFPIQLNIFNTMNGKDFQYRNQNLTQKIKYNRIFYIIQTKQNSSTYIYFTNHENIHVTSDSNSIENDVQSISTNSHEFFLVPNKTIHTISRNQIALEISASIWETNQNDKQVRYQPVSIKVEENQYEEQHLLTNDLYIYDIQRLIIEPNESIQITRLTENRFHLCILVAGDAIEIEFNSIDHYSQKQNQQYNYLETFLIPATIREYRLRPIIQKCKSQSFILLIIYLK